MEGRVGIATKVSFGGELVGVRELGVVELISELEGVDIVGSDCGGVDGLTVVGKMFALSNLAYLLGIYHARQRLHRLLLFSDIGS